VFKLDCLTWYPILPSLASCTPLPTHQIVYRYSRFQWDQQVFLLPGTSWSRTYSSEAWKLNSKASSSNTSELSAKLRSEAGQGLLPNFCEQWNGEFEGRHKIGQKSLITLVSKHSCLRREEQHQLTS
jgi:hypothetical protein